MKPSIMNPTMLKIMRALAVAIFAATILVAPARSQDMQKKDATPKPVPSASEAVLEQWNDIGRKLIDMAEDFPRGQTRFQTRAHRRDF